MQEIKKKELSQLSTIMYPHTDRFPHIVTCLSFLFITARLHTS